jgi:hypothetical protein
MTPEQEHQARQRGHELVRLTDRWGELYRIWSDHGLWWASQDGDKLSGDAPAALESLLCEHMAMCRDRGQRNIGES